MEARGVHLRGLGFVVQHDEGPRLVFRYDKTPDSADGTIFTSMADADFAKLFCAKKSLRDGLVELQLEDALFVSCPTSEVPAADAGDVFWGDDDEAVADDCVPERRLKFFDVCALMLAAAPDKTGADAFGHGRRAEPGQELRDARDARVARARFNRWVAVCGRLARPRDGSSDESDDPRGRSDGSESSGGDGGDGSPARRSGDRFGADPAQATRRAAAPPAAPVLRALRGAAALRRREGRPRGPAQVRHAAAPPAARRGGADGVLPRARGVDGAAPVAGLPPRAAPGGVEEGAPSPSSVRLGHAVDDAPAVPDGGDELRRRRALAVLAAFGPARRLGDALDDLERQRVPDATKTVLRLLTSGHLRELHTYVLRIDGAPPPGLEAAANAAVAPGAGFRLSLDDRDDDSLHGRQPRPAAGDAGAPHHLRLLHIFRALSPYFDGHHALATPKKDEKIIPVIMGMATGNPPYRASQQQALAIAESCPECNSIKPVLARIYGNSRIDYRFMAVPDFTPEQKLEGDENFFDKDLMFKMPVEKRLDMFREKSVPLVTKLIKTLGLWRGVDRSLIGFMGCAAAMNGFRVANDFAMSHPGKMALMVCVEISSVHTTFDDNVNDAILHAIFADGCAAAVISAEKPGSAAAKGKFGIVDTHGWLMEGTEDGITLSINENGISCILSKYLPQYIAKNMAGYVDSFLGMHGLQKTDMDFWAIHPGGRRIIEEAQNGLGLSEEQANVMFVLELILNDHKKALAKGERGLKQGIAFSFSPGVGAEGILINVM
ncbi:naringenin-chalcone synthase [Aureococcus anophagefferens]|nr:naringenin-chalcone synthase [Aureococcus anophagefferens]